MRFREVYDNPEAKIENLSYGNPVESASPVRQTKAKRKSIHDLQKEARFKELEEILINYLEQSPESREQSTLNNVIYILEQEINNNIKHDIKWKQLLELIEKVKAIMPVQKKQAKSFEESLKVDVQSNKDVSVTQRNIEPIIENVPSQDIRRSKFTKLGFS